MNTMKRSPRALLSSVLRATVKPAFHPIVPISVQRAVVHMSGLVTRVPRDMARETTSWGGVPGEIVTAGEPRQAARLLYLHGGGYCVGSPKSYRPLTGALARICGMPVHVPHYRRAPEHPFPAALDDALAVYRALAQADDDPIVLVGDSAGGGLALSLAVAVRDAGLPQPAMIVLLSPWVDLTGTAESLTERARQDPMLSAGALRRWARAYAGERRSDPQCSPLFADLSGLPPVLIQVGTEEVLYDDAARLTERLNSAGTRSLLQVYAGLWHDFQLHAGVLEEADAALTAMARYLDAELLTLVRPASVAA